MPLGGCKLREAHIHLWEPQHGLWGPEKGEAHMAGRHGCTHRGGLGRGMAIQSLVLGLKGRGREPQGLVALAHESEGVLGRCKSEGEASSVLLPTCTLGRTHHLADNRRDRDKLGEGLVWGKTESPP